MHGKSVWRVGVVFACTVLAGTQLDAIDSKLPDSWDLLIRQTDELHREGKLAEAERAARMALLAANAFRPVDERLPVTHGILASVYRDQGRCSEARVNYARAAALYKKQANPNRRREFTAIADLIDTACECDDFSGARKLVPFLFRAAPAISFERGRRRQDSRD